MTAASIERLLQSHHVFCNLHQVAGLIEVDPGIVAWQLQSILNFEVRARLLANSEGVSDLQDVVFSSISIGCSRREQSASWQAVEKLNRPLKNSSS